MTTVSSPSLTNLDLLSYPCVVPSKEVDNEGILYNYCLKWCHPECSWMNKEEYLRLGGIVMIHCLAQSAVCQCLIS